MKKIRLVVFNEPYWDKGLIYSQNILPLLQLVKTKEYSLDVLSFTSLPFYLRVELIFRLLKMNWLNMG